MNNFPVSCCTHNTRKSILKEVIENVVLFLMNLLCFLNDDSGCLVQGHFQPEIWWIINIKGNKTNISMSNKWIWVGMEQEKGSVQCEIWQVCMLHTHTHTHTHTSQQITEHNILKQNVFRTLYLWLYLQPENKFIIHIHTILYLRFYIGENQFLSPYRYSTKKGGVRTA